MSKHASATGQWALLSHENIRAIDGSGDVYLHRYRIIKTPWFAVYVHDLNLPDYGRDPHDHPWTFWSLVLRGGYTERVWDAPRGIFDQWLWRRGSAKPIYKRRWLAGTFHKMIRDQAHIIDFVQPNTKTLVICGRRRKTWGFYTPAGFVHWKDYLSK